MPTLFVVATPIGNLQDMTPRAVSTLKQVGLIAAEDTRVTMKLCQVFDIHTPLTSCHRHNEEEKGERLAEQMITEDLDVAIVTDAGTPCISDPGYALVQACLKRRIRVVPIPGSCAAIAALSVCGFDTREFSFYGFLPREKKELKEKLRRIRKSSVLAVVHESPFRVKELLTVLLEMMPETRVSASCDLTKLHELTISGSVSEVLHNLENNPKSEKGEYCLVLDFSNVPFPEEAPADVRSDISIEALLTDQMVKGNDLRTAMSLLQEQGIRKNELKSAAIRLKALFADGD